MEIKILGTGDSNHRKIRKKVDKAINRVGIETEIIDISDIETIKNYGISNMELPVLVINGVIKSMRSVPRSSQIRRWIIEKADNSQLKGYNLFKLIVGWNKNRHFDSFRQRLLQSLLNSQLEHSKILDIGCADGELSIQLTQSAELMVGMDLSKLGLNRAIQNAENMNIDNAFYLMGDANSSPFKPNFFNIALFLEIIEHIYDPASALSEIHRVLKPNGLLLVGTPKRIGGLNTFPSIVMSLVSFLLKIVLVIKARKRGFFLDLQARGIRITNPSQGVSYSSGVPRRGHGHVRIYKRSELINVLKANGFEFIKESGPPLFFTRIAKYGLAFPFLFKIYRKLYNPEQSFLLSRCGNHMYLLFRKIG